MSFLENATLNADLSWVQSDNINDTKLIENGSVSLQYLYSSGTGVGQVNCVWYSTGQVPLSDFVLFNMYSLTRSFFGGTINTSLSGGKLKCLILKNLNTGVGESFVFNGNTFLDPFNGGPAQITIEPESVFTINNKFGYPILSGNKTFSLSDPAGASPLYEIAILGVKL